MKGYWKKLKESLTDTDHLALEFLLAQIVFWLMFIAAMMVLGLVLSNG